MSGCSDEGNRGPTQADKYERFRGRRYTQWLEVKALPGWAGPAEVAIVGVDLRPIYGELNIEKLRF
jgi:hypothetical protein